MSDPKTLALEQNLVLMASAGTGKTHSLITLCLHLLSGAREGGAGLAPSQLCLVTFTDKAAAELRQRLFLRLDALATGRAGDRDEPELRGSFLRLGRPFPPPEAWRRLRDELGCVPVGTFHALCIQLLRRAPAGFGVDPAFEVLEESEAKGLLRDSAERAVLEALEGGDESVADLCRELGFAAAGRGAGLVDHLVEVFEKLREEGLSPDQLRLTEPAQARADFQEALDAAGSAAAEAVRADRDSGGRFAAELGAAQGALDGLTFDTFLEPGRWPALLRAAREVKRAKGGKRDAVARAVGALVEAVEGKNGERAGLGDCYGACWGAVHERSLQALLGEVGKRHRRELARQGRLDFAELLLRARNLLRDHPLVRREVQERFRALLVDEFQDTNRVQLELVVLLAEQREGGPRRVPADPLAIPSLPLEPRFLGVVGDRKQSIYEFRGADVSVFGELAQKIEREGGCAEDLAVNRRSTPELLAFFNGLFAQLMEPRPDARDYEVAYRAEHDDLKPHRRGRGAGPGVERLVFEPEPTARECRAQEADALARRLHQLLSGRSAVRVERCGVLERPRGGDIAVLFRRFSFLEVYRQALSRCGIPHRVLRGRGFYGAQEVLDLASLCALLADPGDALSFAAVLRSPLVAVADASLLKLALAGGGKLALAPVRRAPPASWGLPSAERERLERFLDLYPRLRRERDRLGLRALLQVAIEETQLLVALAGAPYGEQALANVHKLLALAGRRDAGGRADCAAFASELLALADADPTEAQADVLDAQDTRAVQLLTIHQAKGLEWPIVAVADLAGVPPGPGGRVLFNRGVGLGIKPSVAGERCAGRTRRLSQLSQELRRRAAAERRRLLYVALTRARDRLILSGQSPRPAGEAWRSLIDRALQAQPALGALVVDVPAEDLPRPSPPAASQQSLVLEPDARVEEAVRRVRQPAQPQPQSAVFPVTQLQDYFLCPRRYRYAHLIGLSEYPSSFAQDDPVDSDEQKALGPRDPRTRGMLAHKLLEQVDFAKVGTAQLGKHLEALLWDQGLSPSEGQAQEVLGWALRFLNTPFGAAMKAAGELRVHRELPFLLRVGGGEGGPAVYLKGQIDLLFEDAERVSVVDYKASRRRPGGLSAYAFQLRCYALAARQRLGKGPRIRAGIAFLQEREPGPDFQTVEDEADLEPLQAKLMTAADSLLRGVRAHQWPGRERPQCEALGCGYQYRCHPSARAC